MLKSLNNENEFYAIAATDLDYGADDKISLVVKYAKTVYDTLNIEVIATIKTADIEEEKPLETSYGSLIFKPMYREDVNIMVSTLRSYICPPRCYSVGLGKEHSCGLCVRRESMRPSNPWILPEQVQEYLLRKKRKS